MNPELPEEIVETFRQLVHNADIPQWKIGDFLCEVADETLNQYAAIFFSGSVSKAHSWLINSLASNVGIQNSTLRDRECISRFFPQNIRHKIQHLTYHHARALKSAGEDWEMYLDWINHQSDINSGKLPSVEKIRDKIKQDGMGVELWKLRLKRAIPILMNIAYDKDCPVDLQTEVLNFMSRVENYSGSSSPSPSPESFGSDLVGSFVLDGRSGMIVSMSHR